MWLPKDLAVSSSVALTQIEDLRPLMRSLFLMIAMILIVPSAAWAWGQNTDCTEKIFKDGFSFDPSIIGVAALDGDDGTKHHFYAFKGKGNAECPEAGDAACAMKAYVVTYDHVVVGFEDSGYYCSMFIAENGKTTTGFLANEELTFIDNVYDHEAPALADWVGVFRNGDRSLALQQENEGFKAQAKIKNRDFVLGGLAENNAGELYLKQDDKCTAEMRLFNDEYLFVGNPRGQCGLEALVGVYRRQ